MNISAYAKRFNIVFPGQNDLPWNFVSIIPAVVAKAITQLNPDAYTIHEKVAVHKTAVIEQGVIIKPPAIISANCFLGAHAYLRGGIWLDENVSIGPGCEVKSSVILSNSSLAHFNFVGDSIIGSGVNMEAGSIVANHLNEREDKQIRVRSGSHIINTGVIKFGALIGDNSKIGANAVLSPGTILTPQSIVKRLELIDQCAQ